MVQFLTNYDFQKYENPGNQFWIFTRYDGIIILFNPTCPPCDMYLKRLFKLLKTVPSPTKHVNPYSIKYYLGRRYPYWHIKGSSTFIEFSDLPGCMFTYSESISLEKAVLEAQRLWIKEAYNRNIFIPLPEQSVTKTQKVPLELEYPLSILHLTKGDKTIKDYCLEILTLHVKSLKEIP